MKKILAFILAVGLIALASSPNCAAAEARRIAILPVAATFQARESAAVEAKVAGTLSAWFRTPLSSFVKVYDIIPADEIRAALPPDGAFDPRRPDLLRLRELAVRLDADLVLAVIITDIGEYTSRNHEGDFRLKTDLAMRLIGYKADSQRFIDIKDREDYDGDWSDDGLAIQRAVELTERLLGKAAGGREFWPR